MMSSYHDLLQKLFDLQTKQRGKLDLSLMRALCAELGNPQDAFKSVHVAGTNGKGSVTTLIAGALQAQVPGGKIALYTSPHISSFRERIRINKKLITEEDVVKTLSAVFEAADKNDIPASFFELTTAAAFLYFAHSSVDYAVIETGLGGRHDATNIIRPVVSVITSISLEHTELLGGTIEAIAYEKAGIIKQEAPVVIGPTVPLSVVAPIAKKLHSAVFKVEGSFQDYRAENIAISAKTLECLGYPLLEEELADFDLPPCRFEEHLFRGFPVIFDVAHNPAGMEKLSDLLEEHYPGQRFIIVAGISKTKDLIPTLSPLISHARAWIPVEAPNGRSFPQRTVTDALLQLGIDKSHIIEELKNPGEAMKRALDLVEAADGILVCGTFFIMADARQAFGINEPRDALELNEKQLPRV